MSTKTSIVRTSAASPRCSRIGLVAAAAGAFAVGAVAIGALAIGRLAIRRIVVNSAEFKSLKIQDLAVARLNVAELTVSDSLKLPAGDNRFSEKNKAATAEGDGGVKTIS